MPMKQFFQDLAKYDVKRKILNDSGNFLIETVEEPIATEIKQTLLMLNGRFKELVKQFRQLKAVEIMSRLTQWLKHSEELMARELPCKHAVLKEYLNSLDVSYNRVIAGLFSLHNRRR